MCNKKQMYGAEYFLIPAPKIMKPIFKKINTLEKRIRKMYTFTYLTLFTFKLEPTEVQDAAKRPNFEFSQFQPSPPPCLNGLRKIKVSKQWQMNNV